MMINSWKDFGLLVETELANNPVQGEPNELYDPIDYTLKLGGKRIRPVMCLLAAQLFGGNQQDAMKAAIGVEIFHNFTLVHDDIMDEAPLRRGSPTVHEKWNRDIAILSGDVMFVKAYEYLVESSSIKLKEVLHLFNKTAIEVCEGQQMDMNFETEENVSLKQYLKMIELKTAVLLACSLKIGALISGASIEDANLIYDFGKNLGIAFQIQDDYLDAYADPDKFGKRVGGDIISNKKTYLFLTAIERANAQQKELFKEYENIQDEQVKVKKVLALYEELGIPELTKTAMQSFHQKSKDSLGQVKLEKQLKAPLVEAADMLMERIS